jgi:DNA modification methylase
VQRWRISRLSGKQPDNGADFVTVQIINADCREALKGLADASVQACITSPPYFGLRDYGVDGQIGLEESPAAFVAQMVEVFREVRRALRDDGTLWLNLGDSYASQGGSKSTPHLGKHFVDRARGQEVISRSKRLPRGEGRWGGGGAAGAEGLKPKDLMGIPWRVAFALQDDGWYLRQDIIWSKPNPMPESVTDRCTKAHEYLFLLSKSERYYFDAAAIAEPLAAASVARLAQDIAGQQGSDRMPCKTNGAMKAVRAKGNRKTFRGGGVYTKGQSFDNDAAPANDSVGNAPNERDTRNKRSVWTVATQPFKEAHFATFPPELIEPCVLAGSRAGSLVLDPFGGAGTTGLVADRLQRDAVLIELNPQYAALARKRITADAPLLAVG